MLQQMEYQLSAAMMVRTSGWRGYLPLRCCSYFDDFISHFIRIETIWVLCCCHCLRRTTRKQKKHWKKVLFIFFVKHSLQLREHSMTAEAVGMGIVDTWTPIFNHKSTEVAPLSLLHDFLLSLERNELMYVSLSVLYDWCTNQWFTESIQSAIWFRSISRLWRRRAKASMLQRRLTRSYWVKWRHHTEPNAVRGWCGPSTNRSPTINTFWR